MQSRMAERLRGHSTNSSSLLFHLSSLSLSLSPSSSPSLQCEAYLTSKKTEFAAKLHGLIGNVRQAIAKVWEEMRVGPATRHKLFPGFFVPGPEGFDEALFEAHEAYLASALVYLEGMKPILRGLEKREELRAEKTEYEAIISDPSRLLAKGSSAARLREEKLERRVKKELPAVTSKLRKSVQEWEAVTGTPLLVMGE